MAQAETVTAKPRSKYTAWIIAAVVVIVPLAVIGARLVSIEEDVTLLKRTTYEKAKSKWNESGITSYNLDLAFSGGDQVRQIHLEVRDNQVTECLEDGHHPSQKGAWDDWTIDNQFAIIGIDLDKSERPGGFAVRDTVMITLHADFDPKYGIPRTYHRKARGNTPLQSKWRVVDFEPIGKDNAASEKPTSPAS
jgi:hypothetical protein